MKENEAPSAKLRAPVADSVAINLRSAPESAVIALVEKIVKEDERSARISLRMSGSAMVSLMNKIGNHASIASSVLTLKGSNPAR